MKYSAILCEMIVAFVGVVEFLKLNPVGQVPALIDGDTVIADSFAILMASFSFSTDLLN